jgi:HK97 family phage major capsid protein
VPYNNVIARGDTNEVPDDLSTEIIQNATDQSAVMSLFRRANVSKRQNRFPVLAALPTAYWVNGDTGLKQTTQMAWANKMLNVEELAAIVPVPENVIDDADFDVWGEVRPRLEEAIGRALDEAVLAGVNAPAAFPTNVRAAAIAAGNTVDVGATPAQGGAFGDMDNLIGLLEDDGYDPTGYAFDRKMKGLLRKSRNTTGDRNDRDRTDARFSEFDGDPITYVGAGIFPADAAGAGKGLLAVAAQWDKFVLGVRKDITMKVLDQAVIQDNTGAIIYNLPQQDMVALRVTFRAGWEFANPIQAGVNNATTYPAAVLQDNRLA